MAVVEDSQGFRNTYLDYAQLTAQLHAWAEAHPALVRLTGVYHNLLRRWAEL